MRSSQRRSLLARGTKAVLPKQWPAGGAKHTFVRCADRTQEIFEIR